VKELPSPELCRSAIETYERDPRRHPGYTVGSRGEKNSYDDVKLSTDLGIDNEGVGRRSTRRFIRRSAVWF
jgi:hypothetical protein